MLLSPFYCWRFWRSKSDWFSIQCSLYWTMLPSPFPVDTYWGLATLNPLLSFFPTKMKHRLRTVWFWQDCTVLNQQNLLMIIQEGKSVFISCFWYWGPGTVAQIISQWYLIHLLVSGTWYIIYNNTKGKNDNQEIHSVDYPYVF